MKMRKCCGVVCPVWGLAATGLLLTFGLWACASPDSQQRRAPVVLDVVERQLAPDIYIEVNPGIELLAGIQTATQWCQPDHPGAGDGSTTKYYDELEAFFAPHSGAEAAKVVDRLDQVQDFNYDAPPAMVLASTGGLALEAPQGGYSAYLTGRAGGQKALEDMGTALADLARTADFAGFYNQHREWYGQLLDRACKDLDAGAISTWLRDYYGGKDKLVFHFVLAPSMMRGGGYGTTVVRTENGQVVNHVYQIVRRAEDVVGKDLVYLSLHEFGHHFVNPAVGAAIPASARGGLERLFDPVRDQMAAMAYTELTIFLNELVLRACTIKGIKALGVWEIPAESLLYNEALQGFYPVNAVWDILADYDKNRTLWPDLASFAPVLLDRLAAKADELIAARAHFSCRDIGDGIVIAFDQAGYAPGPDLFLGLGATNGTRRISSRYMIEGASPGGGPAALTLSGDADTDLWYSAGLGLKPKKGTLVLDAKVRGRNIRREGSQFDNAWIGFISTERSGKRSFAVHALEGSSDWTDVHKELVVDPSVMSQVELMIFLSKSGELSVGDIRLHWKQDSGE